MKLSSGHQVKQPMTNSEPNHDASTPITSLPPQLLTKINKYLDGIKEYCQSDARMTETIIHMATSFTGHSQCKFIPDVLANINIYTDGCLTGYIAGLIYCRLGLHSIYDEIDYHDEFRSLIEQQITGALQPFTDNTMIGHE